MTWTERDVILYALGVGAGQDELHLVYENSDLVTLPTFGVVPTFPAFAALGTVLDFDRRMTLHGRQRIELDCPIPSAGSATTTGVVDQIWDKGSAAVLVAKTETRLANGDRLLAAESTAFVRNGGGFGGDRGPSTPPSAAPERTPDIQIESRTSVDQALLYRLSGDRNPLHADPAVAVSVGFERPILHGLCTYGIVGRIAFETFANGDPNQFRSMEARFAGIVYPGETLVSSFWLDEDDGLRFVTRVAERDTVVLDDGRVGLGARG
jgi:acyl dehydratase